MPAEVPDYTRDAFAGLISDARQRVIAGGVRRIPTPIYRTLLGYYPASLLQRSRFAIATSPVPRIPYPCGGEPVAITLVDIILFKTERPSQTDLKLWAHQLTHVMQYQRWGIEGFAERYVHDNAAVEREAADNAARFTAWLRNGAERDPRRWHHRSGELPAQTKN